MRKLLVFSGVVVACRTPESHAHHDAVPSALPAVSASASSGAPIGPTKKCGDAEVTLTGGAVTGLVSSPASILLGQTNGKRALVLSDPKWADCDVVIEEQHPLPGPFSGASGSDAKWQAAFYSSTQNVYVVVLDGSGTVQGLASVPCTPFGNQGRIESRDVFADGHTIFYSGHVAADGWDALESHLFGFVDGKFAPIFTDKQLIGMGSTERYEVTTSAIGMTPPTVTLDLSTRESVVSNEHGGFRTLQPKKKHTVARWNGHAFR